MNNRIAKPVLYLLPALLVLCVVIAVPSLYSLYLSFFSWNGVSPNKIFVGVQNYIDLFMRDPVFTIALKNTIFWVIASLIFITVAALFLALLLNRPFFGRIVFRGIFYSPYIMSGIVVSLMWSWLYHPSMGFFNAVLEQIGLEPLDWLADPSMALGSVFVASLWHSVGAPMVLFLAGLQAIPKDLYEAVKVEGANSFQTLIHVTIPLLRESFVVVIATTLIGAMKVFDIIYAMTGGGPAQKTQVLASWMYYHTFQFNNFGTGSALSWILVILVMIVTIPYVLQLSRDSHT
ncbi:carbohydrate ABC transporter permease [Paenibacillus fonticola]|uniref:carbohydrate ABC transporter permease n=1 Tax=Paenibacillus fonticola TaxID=379896 RepID=UPI000370DFC7|nr:sugar ABC transporter permease [Paenibacillus fonticola]